MKKLFFILSTIILIFSACNIKDLFIDEEKINNELSEYLNNVSSAEEKFYESYISFDTVETPNNLDIKTIKTTYTNFTTATNELDKYFTNTKFASSQKKFINKYNSDYKTFLNEYINKGQDFISNLDLKNIENTISIFEELDEYSVKYVNKHNDFIELINTNIK